MIRGWFASRRIEGSETPKASTRFRKTIRTCSIAWSLYFSIPLWLSLNWYMDCVSVSLLTCASSKNSISLRSRCAFSKYCAFWSASDRSRDGIPINTSSASCPSTCLTSRHKTSSARSCSGIEWACWRKSSVLEVSKSTSSTRWTPPLRSKPNFNRVSGMIRLTNPGRLPYRCKLLSVARGAWRAFSEMSRT